MHGTVPNEEYTRGRFSALLGGVRGLTQNSVSITDLGCGSGELLDHVKELKLSNIQYVGADRAEYGLELARHKHPEATFVEVDFFAPDTDLANLTADYVLANGLFTGPIGLAEAAMQSSWMEIMVKIWRLARLGVAVNLKSSIAGRENRAEFHVPMEDAVRLLHDLAGRDIVLCVNKGPHEYTAYAYKEELRKPPDGHGMLGVTTAVSREIPVLRPSVATRDKIVPFLDRIDRNRIYSNFGPLVLELNDRLCHSFRMPTGAVLCASSGTAALAGAILAVAGPAKPERPLAIVPSFTFVATALAVEQCGYDLLLMDIDEETWMLSAGQVQRRSDLDRIGLVVPVAPFGRDVPQEPWLEFQRTTGIPVVVDAAASFEGLTRQDGRTACLVPTVLSFHATKSYSTGEGGAIVSLDTECILHSARALNFGVFGDRNCRGPGFNGKMSEYHAAVGLAELDGWSAKAADFGRVVGYYDREFKSVGLSDRLFTAPDIASCYTLFCCRTAAEAVLLAAELTQQGIGHRFWYGGGLHAHQYFLRRAREELPVTNDIAARLIGLPAGPTLSHEQIKRVASVVERHVSR